MSYRVVNPFRAFDRGYERDTVLTVEGDLSCWLPTEDGAAKVLALVASGDLEEIGAADPDSDLPATFGGAT